MRRLTLLAAALLIPAAVRADDLPPGAVKIYGDGGKTSARVIAVSPDERSLATGYDGNTVHIFEIASGKIVQKLTWPSEGIDGLLFLANGKTLVTCAREQGLKKSGGQALRFWDWESAKETQGSAFIGASGNGPLVRSPDDKVIGRAQGGMMVYLDQDKGYGFPPLKLPYGDFVRRLTPSVRCYADLSAQYNQASKTGFPSLAERSSGVQHHELRWHCAAFDADGSRLAIGFRSRLAVLDPASGKELKKLAPITEPGPQEPVPWYRHVMFTTDGKRLVAVQDVKPVTDRLGTGDYGKAVADQEIQLWDLSSGARVAVYRGHRGPIRDLALAENGRVLFTAGADGTLVMWDLDVAPPTPPPPADVAGLTARLLGNDEFAAMQSMQALVADPDKTKDVINAWMANVPANEKVAKLVSKLASAELANRLAAVQELAELRTKEAGDVEAHLIRAAVKVDADESSRLCALSLLEPLHQQSTPSLVHVLRVIKLSEWIADPAAKDRLKLFSERLPTERGGKAARAALQRIAEGVNRKEYDALPPVAGSVQRPPVAPLRILALPQK